MVRAEQFHNGCVVNVKCGQSHCKFQLTAYTLKSQSANGTTPSASAPIPVSAITTAHSQDYSTSIDTQRLLEVCKSLFFNIIILLVCLLLSGRR